MTSAEGTDPARRPSRVPPAPLEGPRLTKHFKAFRRVLSAQYALCADLSPTTTGGMREWFTQEFLRHHLPGVLSVGSGHILYEDVPSSQQDIIVYRRDSLALPIGSTGLFLPESVIACIEVKSTLNKAALVDSAKKFASLHSPVLKAVVANRLTDGQQYRAIVGKWAVDARLSASELPDLIVIADNAPIIRGRGLRVLDGLLDDADEPEFLYKYGSYDKDRWLSLALLVFELAQRANAVDWRPYLQPVLPAQATLKKLPDHDT